MTSPALKNVGTTSATFSCLKLVKTSRVIGHYRRQKPAKEATSARIQDMALKSGAIPKIAKAIRADRVRVQEGDGVGHQMGKTK
eukprot:1574463-Prorocentrum_lima.AAC.1